MPMKSFGDMVGECWKTHKKVGMKMKGGKMVPDCRPKNEEFVGEEGINKDPSFDIMRPGGKNSPFNADGTPKVNPKNFKLPGEKGRDEYLKTLNMGEARIDEKKDPRTQLTSLDVKLNSGAYKAYNKDVNAPFGTSKRFNPIIKTIEAVKSPKLDIKETGVKNKIEINPEIKTEAAKAPVKK